MLISLKKWSSNHPYVSSQHRIGKCWNLWKDTHRLWSNKRLALVPPKGKLSTACASAFGLFIYSLLWLSSYYWQPLWDPANYLWDTTNPKSP
jgi:hypothetical protein